VDDSRSVTALAFPGMGPSRFADLGRFLLVNPVARRMVTEADERLGYSLLDNFRDTEGDYTEYGQVAFFVCCLALAEWAREEHGIDPQVCTGPSFGEKPLTAFVGSLTLPDAVAMTAGLARCTAEYFSTEHRDVVTHSFVRTPGERLEEILAELSARGGWYNISCYIDRDLHMVSLHERHLEWLQRRIRGAGGMSLYTMRPPMHSAAFGALRRKAEDEVIGALPFADPLLPVVADQDGSVIRSAEGIRTMLLDSFVRPLRWPDVVASLKGLGVDTLCVAGPDSLFGRVACTTEAFRVVQVNPRSALQPRRRGAAVG
jgi:[acyl-carrier-protein] S-malonyltransferase